jgi:hypothetical protein
LACAAVLCLVLVLAALTASVAAAGPTPTVTCEDIIGLGGWRKAGLVVRGDSPPVRVSVPKEWLTRVAVGWGSVRETGVLRIASCPPSGALGDWNPYAGGFSLRRPACVPLTFRVGTREKTVRFSIGKRCR